MAEYVLGIDQSTQGTKALLFSAKGELVCRADRKHAQIVNERGWVEHDPEEIIRNTIGVVADVANKAGIDKADIRVVGISNQRETVVAWDAQTGKPVYNAIVWQCGRGEAICAELREKGYADLVHEHTGIQLSPYFSGAKLAWILRNVPEAAEKAGAGTLMAGTIDSWLVYNLTGGKEFRTDYSNAARTQLFNIRTLSWDKEICDLYGIPVSILPTLTDSDGLFGTTDFDGFLPAPVPIHGVLGDSNGALFGQDCTRSGNVKATYGTGTSVMMNIGEEPVFSDVLATSLAWRISGNTQYVLEGNINYSGAVIEWMKSDAHLIESASQTEDMARAANPSDTTYLVPAFSGLSAPYLDSNAKAVICGMTRVTGRNELVKAGLESIAYQIADVVGALEKATELTIDALRVDGGATHNGYLMQFQSAIIGKPVRISRIEELSGLGAAYMAGLGCGLYDKEALFASAPAPSLVAPEMGNDERERKYKGWTQAVRRTLWGTDLDG